ncbi:hypothetical protein SLEP1_g12329 [Rubroshorea leprosula]|uniref:Uncharacterized protein n=1 Tax=Rubroshorea leprosula TaxID=152421 RepID=A0AAV5ILY5_9ROSI|nr:hypothetical protein SLEP1_g12329 [Rubroshorea leprosula]
MGRGTRGESSSKEASNTLDKAQKQLRRLIRGPRKAASTQQQMPSLSQPPSQQQLPTLSQPPSRQQLPSLSQPPSRQQLQQQQPTLTPPVTQLHQQQLPTWTHPVSQVQQQPPLPDQELGDEAPMEEDAEELVEERNLEAELAAEYDQLDPELDAALEEELSHAVQKTGRGMDKGDEAPTNPSQRKLLKINQRGSFSNERFGRTATAIWKFLYDEPVLFWTNWPEEKKRLAWEMFQV